MTGSILPLLLALATVAGAVGLARPGGFDPDCPDGRPEGDLDPDDPCVQASPRSAARTETGPPRLPPLRPGEARTFPCPTWGGCAFLPVETPPEGARRLQVTVLAEMAGGFSSRATMAPGPHFEPMWADGADYDGGNRTTWTFEAPFAATAWALEFTSMWEDAGGNVTVTVAFA